VVSYNVYRGTTSGGPYTNIGSVTATQNTFTDSTVSSGTTYYYVVRAVIANNLESTNSNEVSATTPPLPPTSLMVTGTGSSPASVTLAWTASTTPTVAGYNVYQATMSGGSYTAELTLVTTLGYTDTTVAYSTTYYYAVTAVANNLRAQTLMKLTTPRLRNKNVY
jgi:fibronectin type 3 domain-containing protein